MLDGTLIILALLPPVLILALILRYGVNIPYWDEWDLVPLFDRLASGQLTFHDLFAPHNEHRMLFPKLVVLVLGSLTHGNVVFEMGLTWLLAALLGWTLQRLSVHTVALERRGRLAMLALISLFVFSPAQAENWLMGMQFLFLIPGLCLVLCLCIAGSAIGAVYRWSLCLALCVVATFTMGNGLLLWVLVPPALIWAGRREPAATTVVLTGGWLVALGLVLFVYFRGFAATAPAMGALAGGGRLLLYLACFLGGPFSRATLSPSAIVAGIVGAAVIVSCLASWAYFALAARRSPTGPRMVPWLVLGAYSLLSGITAGLFRIKFGTDQALATRYVTFSLFGFIALAHVAVLVFQDLKPRTKARYRRSVAAIGFSGLAVVAVLQAVSAPVYLREMAAGSRDRLRAREALRYITVVADPGPAAYLHLDIKEVRERAAVLDRLGLLSRPLVHDASLPAAPAATAADARYGRLESLVAVGDGYEAVGWAAIPERRAPADIVLLACERGGGAPIATMVALPAAPPWNRAAGARGYLAEAGWRARLRRAWLPEGTTRISAWGFDRVTGEFHELAGAVSLRR